MSMTVRERFIATMEFKKADRLPVIEMFPWWDKTIHKWHTEGLPSSLTSREDICRHFDLEVYQIEWFSRSRAANRPLGHLGKSGGLKEYSEKKVMLFPWPVINKQKWEKWAEQQKNGETVIWVELDGFFWFPREVLGVERNLFAYYDEPEILHKLNNDLLEWTLQVLEELCKFCVPDIIHMAEDMSYNHGPMISMEMFEEFIKPYYIKLLSFLKSRNIITFIDTDGNSHKLIPWFLDLGVEGFLPNERQAGVDIVQIRDEHPYMRFIGGFDKMLMNKGEDNVRNEFERLLTVAKKGGFIMSPDHQTPPGVSYQDYRLYVKLLNEYAKKAVE